MMEEFIANFHFLRPWWLVAALLPLFGFVRNLRGRGLQSSWQKIVDARLLDFLLVQGSSSQRRLLNWLALFVFLSAIVAATGPSWQKVEIPALEAKNPAMILLNLSSDMKAADLTPSRLERAKYKIKDLLRLLRGAQAGLEVYSGEPFVISPLTDDTTVLENLLPAISYNIMPLNGDRLDRAIELATARFRGAGHAQGEIIVFTPDVGQNFEQAVDAARKAKAAGYNVSIIGVSATAAERPEMVARAGGGSYILLQNGDTDILPLAEKINGRQSELTEGKNQRAVWLDYGYYLLFLPLACCLYFFRRGILAAACFCLLCSQAEASFFFNADQDGLRAFNQQNYQKAADLFASPAWKGASYYRQGDYDKAYGEYARGNDATALYNQGNALAKSGKINEAIAKYEETLKLEPAHEDAKFNLEYLKKQQEQQQKNQDRQQDQKQTQQGQQSDKDQAQQNPSQGDNQKNDQQQPREQENGEDGRGDNRGNNQEQQDSSQKQPAKAHEQSPQELDPASEQKQADGKGGALMQQGQQDEEKYDEKIQARTQQLREIPEDAGGLLRAFIAEEYRRNRYGEMK